MDCARNMEKPDVGHSKSMGYIDQKYRGDVRTIGKKEATETEDK